MEKKYLQKILIEDQSFEDLDFVLHDEFGIDHDNNQQYEIIEIGNSSSYGYIVNISKMIEKLQHLKEKGATHIEMDYNEDHIGYDISAFEVRTSTEEEILNFEKAKKAREDKDRKRAELQRQLRELDDIKGEYANEDLPF
jgi:hypothetical protein